MRNTNYWLSLPIICITCLLAGCTLGPKYEPPQMDIPDCWSTTPPAELDLESLDCFVWWESLNDPILNSLIQRASQQNLDVFIAGTRILEARAEGKGKTAELYPHIDASMTCGRASFNKKALRNIWPTCQNRKHSNRRNVSFFEIGFDAEWEIDLFGYRKHEINAMQAKLEGVEESFKDVWISLSAEIARNYIELRSLQQRLHLITRNIEFQQDTVLLTKELVNIGIGNAIDLLQFEEQLNTLSAQKPLLELSIDKAIHRLSILLNYTPGELFSELCEPEALPLLPCEKPIGIPSELLRRRPDIRRAERELAAATETIGAAIAALFPRLSLYGFVGDISTQLRSLTNGTGVTWFAAPQLLLPIFNSRLLMQDVNLNKIRTQRAIFDYQKTVLIALEEVENGIASFKYELQRSEYLAAALQTTQNAYRLVFDLYRRGLKDYLEVLSISRSLITAEEAYLQSQTELLFDYISLYKALGGGM